MRNKWGGSMTGISCARITVEHISTQVGTILQIRSPTNIVCKYGSKSSTAGSTCSIHTATVAHNSAGNDIRSNGCKIREILTRTVSLTTCLPNHHPSVPPLLCGCVSFPIDSDPQQCHWKNLSTISTSSIILRLACAGAGRAVTAGGALVPPVCSGKCSGSPPPAGQTRQAHWWQCRCRIPAGRSLCILHPECTRVSRGLISPQSQKLWEGPAIESVELSVPASK